MSKQYAICLCICLTLCHLAFFGDLGWGFAITGEWAALIMCSVWHFKVHGWKGKEEHVAKRFFPIVRSVMDEDTKQLVQERVYHQFYIVEHGDEGTDKDYRVFAGQPGNGDERADNAVCHISPGQS